MMRKIENILKSLMHITSTLYAAARCLPQTLSVYVHSMSRRFALGKALFICSSLTCFLNYI